MFNAFKIKTLGTMIAFLLVITGAIVIAGSVSTFTEVQDIGKTWKQFERGPAKKVVILNDLRGALGYGGMVHQFKNFVLRADRPRIVKLHNKIRAATKALTSYENLGVNDMELNALRAIAGVVAKYADAAGAAEILAGKGATARAIDKSVKISDGPALKALDILDHENHLALNASAGAVYQSVDAVTKFVQIAMVVSSGLIISLIAIFIWFARARIATPIRQIGEVVGELASGSQNFVIPGTGRGDELGDMARSLEKVQTAGVEAFRLKQMVEALPIGVMTCDPETFVINYANPATVETYRKLGDNVQVPVEDVVGSCIDIFHKDPVAIRKILSDPNNLPFATTIRIGNETARLNADAMRGREGEYLGPMVSWSLTTEQTRIADDFEANVKNVVDAVSASAAEMRKISENMVAITGESSGHAASASAATQQSSSNVQTVSAAAEQLSSSINEIARQVAESTKTSKIAVEAAERTNQTVLGLSDGSQKIGEVISLINDIASQTNLLALNATIEAARAGEAGKGFAVVASEVKSLADQTAKATDEITAQIDAIQSSTNDAVAAIGEIGKKISEMDETSTAIAAAVEEQGSATGEISRNAQQASAGTEEASANVLKMTEASEQTGEASQQVLQAATELSRQAETLSGEVEKFLASVKAA